MFKLDSIKTRLEEMVKINAASAMTDEQIILKEIKDFKISQKRRDMVNGISYFKGKHDILQRKRTVIGKDGEAEEVNNLPNNRIVDNQYRKMVMQKTNYILGRPLSIKCENKEYSKQINQLMNRKFARTLKLVCEDALNCGIGYILPMYSASGEFVFKRLNPTEIIPLWKDAEHTELDAFIRFYDVSEYEGKKEKIITKVEVYDVNGVSYFQISENEDSLIPEADEHLPYFSIGDNNFNWTKIPLIAFKYNSREIPLINMVKSLQDGLNLIESNFQNNMEEDPRNSIMVLVNYDGENLGEFRRNLSTYGAVKVRSMDGSHGDVKTLQVEVNSENYKAILSLFKKAIIENAMGYDAKDDRIGGNANQMNIQSMYSDIDLDANGMETEFQAALDELLYFINCHLFNTGKGDYESEIIDIVFNRDMMMNKTEQIENIQKSVGILSDETLLANHPWVSDPQEELERIEKQKKEEFEQFGGYNEAFNNPKDEKEPEKGDD